ncbi:MAG TPA: cysteine desulfurase family protein [Gaiellaceae bacterium]|nr:cysteine desulfurase family protein [Gaiellaceae bacterium]
MIDLDQAASTPVRPAVTARMRALLEDEHANPSSLHAAARSARKVVEEARETVAAALGARPEEIVFTSGGTEADNLAVLGAARRRRREGRDRVVVSAIEHRAVLDSARHLEREGFDVAIAPVEASGRVDLEALGGLVDGRTSLVAVMAANNETGVVQPIDAVAEIARAHGAWFHTDAVQSFAWLDARTIDADLAAVSAHKIGGPKGVGALVVRRGIRIEPILHGGGQERGVRPGTLNTVGIGGFAAAVEELVASRDAVAARVATLRDRLEARLAALDAVTVTAAGSPRLPGHVHVCVDGVDAETLLVLLDAAGVCASSGSACSSGAAEVSHVLRAMGIPDRRARGALRLSLGATTTEAQVDEAAGVIERAIAQLQGRR